MLKDWDAGCASFYRWGMWILKSTVCDPAKFNWEKLMPPTDPHWENKVTDGSG